jgi:hypothetical protein
MSADSLLYSISLYSVIHYSHGVKTDLAVQVFIILNRSTAINAYKSMFASTTCASPSAYETAKAGLRSLR